MKHEKRPPQVKGYLDAVGSDKVGSAAGLGLSRFNGIL